MGLEHVFDIVPVEPKAAEVVDPQGRSVVIAPEGNEDTDHEYARARHYELAEKGAEALEIAMRIARETEDPKAIDSLSKLIKTLSDANKALLVLNKDKAEVKTAKTTNGETKNTNIGTAVQNQNNIIFSGTAADLDEVIKQRLNK